MNTAQHTPIARTVETPFGQWHYDNKGNPMNEPATVSRTASPFSVSLPVKADDSFRFNTHDECRLEIRDSKGWLIATVSGCGADAEKKAESLRNEIVRACNSHAALVEALEFLKETAPHDVEAETAEQYRVLVLRTVNAALEAVKG